MVRLKSVSSPLLHQKSHSECSKFGSERYRHLTPNIRLMLISTLPIPHSMHTLKIKDDYYKKMYQ